MTHLAEAHYFFIDPASWAVPAAQDRFLRNLLELLDNLEEFGRAKIAWCAELDEQIWKAPQAPPWIGDCTARNALVPVLYRRFPDALEYFESAHLENASFSPDVLNECPVRAEASLIFRSLAHHCSCEPHRIRTIALRSEQEPLRGTPFSIRCDCHGEFRLEAIIGRRDWIQNFHFVEALWPSGRSEESRSNLLRCVRYKIALIGAGGLARPQLFRPHFSAAFLEDLAADHPQADAILEAMAKRLTLQTHEATQDGALGDELLRGQDTIRRMRVSGAARIHYEIDRDVMTFLRYYSESRHDDGI